MTNQVVIEILTQAKELIKDPSKWAQEEYALDAKGDTRDPEDAKACRWCSIGAVTKVRADMSHKKYNGAAPQDTAVQYLDKAARSLNFVGIVQLNDAKNILNHQTVMNAFDLAIITAKMDAENATVQKFDPGVEHTVWLLHPADMKGIKPFSPILELSNNEDSHYAQYFRSRLEVDALIEKLTAAANEAWPEQRPSSRKV